MLFTKEEWDGILFFTAKSIAYHQGMFRELDKIYQKDIVRYETLANEHPLRHCKLMWALPLEYETKTCRMLGILAAGEEDSGIKEAVIRQIKLVFPEIFQWIKKTSLQQMKRYSGYFDRISLHKTTLTYAFGITGHLIAYLHSDEKFLSENTVNAKILLTTYEGEKEVIKEYLTGLPLVTNYPIPVTIKANESVLKIQNLIKNWGDIVDFTCVRTAAMHEYLEDRDSYFKDKTFSEAVVTDELSWDVKVRVANLIPIKRCIQDPGMQKYNLLINEAVLSIWKICELADISAVDLVSREKFTKSEQEQIWLISVTAPEQDAEFDFDATKYVYNIFIFRLLQAYKKAKALYFRDNEESRLLEQKQQRAKSDAQQQEIQELQRKLAKLQEENQAVQEENQRLREQILSAEREAQEKYEARIAQMQKAFDEQQRKLYDLTPLREFFFSQENEEVIADTSVSLEDAATGLKIATLGGHEVLLKKLKQNYPEFLVLDGTLKSIDFSAQLRNVNLLFLFTEHMSHSVYDNAVAAAERYRIPLAYIRSSNLEAIERQMSAEIEHLKQSERR